MERSSRAWVAPVIIMALPASPATLVTLADLVMSKSEESTLAEGFFWARESVSSFFSTGFGSSFFSSFFSVGFSSGFFSSFFSSDFFSSGFFSSDFSSFLSSFFSSAGFSSFFSSDGFSAS
jgi:hypothetical protein